MFGTKVNCYGACRRGKAKTNGGNLETKRTFFSWKNSRSHQNGHKKRLLTLPVVTSTFYRIKRRDSDTNCTTSPKLAHSTTATRFRGQIAITFSTALNTDIGLQQTDFK